VDRALPRPRPRVVDLCAGLAGLGFSAELAAVITGESVGKLRVPGGLLTAEGRFAGFTGTYLMLIMVVLAARLPWLEQAAGQDQLVRWHRRVSPWALGLLGRHGPRPQGRASRVTAARWRGGLRRKRPLA
jgi:hypothetical protein